MSGFQALIGSICIINLPIAAVTLMTLPFAFPGANMVLSVLLSLVPAAILGTVYVLFSISMPRSGGDYVFISRSLAPSLGFAANFSFAIWNFMFIGISGAWITSVALSGLFGDLAAMTNNHTWVTLANDASKKWVILIVGLVAMILGGLVLLKLSRALKIMVWLFGIGIVGVIATVIVTFSIGHAEFVRNVNHAASYQGIIRGGLANGFTNPHSWIQFSPTISGIALVALVTFFVMYATYTGGEVKNVRRSIPISVYGALAFGGGIFALMAAAAAHTWGHEFVAASQAFSFSTKWPFLSVPNFNFVAGLGSGSIFWSVVANGAFLMLMLANIIFSMITMDRCVFAWAMDRVVPDKVASVSTRTHSPNWAIAVGTVLSSIGLVVFVYTSFSDDLGGITLGFLMTFLFAGIAAVVFPYRRRDLYNQSPARPVLWGIPVLTIAGVLSIIFVGAVAYAYFTNAHYGSNSARDYAVFLGAWAFGFLYYFLARAYRSHQGVPMALSATTLPPD